MAEQKNSSNIIQGSLVPPQQKVITGSLSGGVVAQSKPEDILKANIQNDPNNPFAYYQLASHYKSISRFVDAERVYRLALEIMPNFPAALNSLGITLKNLCKYEEAELCYQKAIALKPDFADAYSNLGVLMRNQGKLSEAIAAYRAAIKLMPDHLASRNNLLFCLNYLEDYAPETYLQEAKAYGEQVKKLALLPYTQWNGWDGKSPLKIGFVSGDFRRHAVGFFLEHMLSQVNREKFQLIAYVNAIYNDDITQKIRGYLHDWVPIHALSDQAAAQKIHQDGVHILVDLSGHTAHNRLSVFSWKPAPVQLSWLGYYASTGVQEMDYFLADDVSVPSEDDAHFTEKIYRLPTVRACFSPPATQLPVSALPALKHGYVTFGSFQNYSKLGEQLLANWLRIMQAIPNAKLRLQCPQFSDAALKAAALNRLSQVGFDASRIELVAGTDWANYMAAYAEVDIVLDTYPFPGGTTTCEALWMGVPTITLRGNRMISRQGASFLKAVGLADWVAENETEYLKLACEKANNIPTLAQLRASLRTASQQSILFDAQQFVPHWQNAMLAMWSQKNPQI